MKKGLGYIAGIIFVALVAGFFMPANESGCTSGVDTAAGGGRGDPSIGRTVEDDASEAQVAQRPERRESDGTGNEQADRLPGTGVPLASGKVDVLLEGVSGEREGRYHVIQIVEADFKYPLIKIDSEYEEDPSTGKGRLISRREMVADHMIVRLKKGTDYHRLRQINQEFGAQVRKRMGAPDSYLVAFECNSIDTLDRMLEAYNRRIDEVAYAEPDYIVYAFETYPDDASFSQLWGLHNTGQSGGTADADIDAPEAWDMAVGTTNVLVGVIDTGIDYTHVDLAANMWVNPGEAGALASNGLDDDGNGYVDDWKGWDFVNDDNDPMDDHYHGTHCAGTIGGVGNNLTGVAGVCWNLRMVGLKFLSASGSGSLSDAVDAIYYATGIGVDLTSNSWGGGGYSQAMADALADADAHDILFVAAAGNSSANNDTSPHYPSSYTNENIIAVAATDHRDGLAYFSCYGAESVDLGAPGVDIYSTSPNDGYRTLSGTSMATPHVAGACALLKSVSPGSSGRRIKDAIMDYADPVSSLTGRCISGARLNLFSSLMRLNTVWLQLNEYALDDASGGNGDGFINPGETVELTAVLRNLGAVYATNVSIAASCDNPMVTVLPSRLPVGDVPGVTAISNAAVFSLQVDSATVSPSPFRVTFVMQDAGGGAWTSVYDHAVYTSGSLSGRVTRSFGTPLAGATVYYDGTISGSVTSDSNGWYSVGLVDGSYTVHAELDGLAGGDTVQVEMPGRERVDFVMGFPELQVTPETVDVTVMKNGQTDFELSLSNLGDATMTYELLADGYERITQGMSYNWVDISQTGTEIPNMGDDRMSDEIPFGFPFPFYRECYSTFRVCGNGFIGLGSGYYASYVNKTLPLPAGTGVPLIALFWDDLNLTYNGSIYYQRMDDDKMIIQYEQVPYFGNSTQFVTCQAILHRDGKIVFQYRNVDIPDRCTVGVDSGDGTNGMTLVDNERYLEDESAIGLKAFGAGWVSFAQSTGTVAAEASGTVTGQVDATGWQALTTHTTRVGVVNVGFEQPHEVEVRMTVLGNPSNQPPVAGDLVVSNREDTSSLFSLPVSDADDEPLYTEWLDPVTHGTLRQEGTGYRYTPPYNFNGTNVLRYKVTDLEVARTGTVTIVTWPVNDLPYVSIRAPAYNAKYPTNQPVLMRAYVTDVEENITQVVMRVSSIPGEVVAALETNDYYACEWPPLPVGSYSLTATAYDGDGGVRTSYARIFNVVDIRMPDDIPLTNMISGVEYSYYEGEWDELPLFDSLTPLQEGLHTGLSLTAYPRRSDYFAYRFQGYVFAPSSGVYRFTLGSDDGSRLEIGGSVVVDNDGLHGITYRNGTIGLAAGYHAFTLDYFDAIGGELLSLAMTYLDPSGSGYTINDFVYRDIASATNPVVYLTAPADSVRFMEGDTVTVRARAYDGNGEISHIGVYRDGEWIGNATNYSFQNYVYEWPSVPVGRHTLYVEATDSEGLSTVSASREIDVYEAIDDSLWTNRDVGAVELPGWCGYSPDEKQFRIEGAGADIWGTQDEFQYVYRPMKGDMEIVARILSVENVHEWSKAGVMIRETTDDHARHAMMLISPVHGIACNARTVTGGDTTNKHQTGISPPCWLRIVRDDNDISTFYSIDGAQWTPFWSESFTNLPETIYAGMAVCSHEDFRRCKALFDHVEVSALGAVRITASAGALAETNAVRSILQVSRSGYAVTNALNVTLQFGGSAENGVDYQLIDSNVTIPVGEDYVDIPFVPLNDEEDEGDETAVITVQVAAPYRVGVPSSVRIRIAENATRAWLLRYFTTNEIAQSEFSDDRADPDCDGIPNLEEFAFGYDPRSFEPVPEAPFQGCLPDSAQAGEKPVVNMRRRIGADDLVYGIQTSDNLIDWESAGRVTEAGSQPEPGEADMEMVTFEVEPAAPWNRTYLRIRVTRQE